ncbi:hypothetical protein LguiB_022911 [Lonicera macranthoides]
MEAKKMFPFSRREKVRLGSAHGCSHRRRDSGGGYWDVSGGSKAARLEGRKADLVEPPDWHEVILVSIERKANNMELSFSLRIMKKQWEQGIKGVGELAYSSASKGQQESKALCLETSVGYDVFALKEIGVTNSVEIYKGLKI